MKTGRKLITSTLLAATAMSFCATSVNATELTWNGTDSNSDWDTSSRVWKRISSALTWSQGDDAIFDSSGSKTVTIKEAIEAGTVTISGEGYKFEFSDETSLTATEFIISEGASLELNETAMLIVGGTATGVALTINGTFTNDGGTIIIGDYDYYTYMYVGLDGDAGVVEISGGTTTVYSQLYVGYIASSDAVANGVIEISGGTTTFSRNVYVGYCGVSGGNDNVSGRITISGDNTTVTFNDYVVLMNGYDSVFEILGGTVTFEDQVDIGRDYLYGATSTTARFTISGDNTTVTFEGIVDVGFSASSTSSDSGLLEISGGTTTFLGAVYAGNGMWVSTSSADGSIYISGGKTTFSSTVFLGYGDSNSGTYYGTLEISGGKTTFSGTVYVGYGHSSSSRPIGTLNISGGETTFSGTVYVGYVKSWGWVSGTVEITGGTTTFNKDVYVGFSYDGSQGTNNSTMTISGGDVTFSGTLHVGDGKFGTGELNLNGGTITLYSAIDNTDSVTVGKDVVFVLDNLKGVTKGNTTTYTVIENNSNNLSSNSTISGWSSLTASNFLLNGVHADITVGSSGTVIVTTYDFADLVWDGTDESNTWADGGYRNWLNGKYADSFYNGDSVTFDDTATNKTVNIEGSIDASTVTVSSGDYVFTGEGSVTAESLTVANGSSLKLTGTGEVKVSSATINGTLEISGGGVSITDMLSSTGFISLSEDTTLVLSGTIDLSNAISNEGMVTLSDGVVFVLDNLEGITEGNTTTYTVITNDGLITGWDSLTTSNFLLNGSIISGRSTIDVETSSGQVTITFDIRADLVWNGTIADCVWTNDGEEIWLNGDDQDVFIAGDNVTFDTDGTKAVSIVGKIEAGVVTVSGSGYTFDFSDDSSVTADSLIIDSGASLEITSGETTITTIEVSSEGTLKISGGTTAADSIEVAGSLELTGGELTVKTITLRGSGSFSGGILNVGEITGNGALTFGNGLTVNLYETTSLNADITLSGNVTFNAEDGESIELSGTLSGGGKLVKDGEGTLTLSGDNTFSGGATISSGTVVAQSETALGSGSIAIDDGATLEIPTSREFTNTTSGNGTLSVASGVKISFTKSVGVKTVEVASGATLSGSVSLTHSNAELVLAGELALDASAGEKISFSNGGTVTLENSATLNISDTSPTSVKPLSDSSVLGAGSNVTIVSGATVSGDIKTFLATDSTLFDLSSDYAVVYDTSKGLSVMILESGDVSSISSGVKLHDGISSDFLSAIVSDDDLDFGTGIKSSDELQSLSNPIVKALATGNISEASKMMDTLAPNDYAAMVAMPTTSFYNDVKAIDNHLAARRERKLDENNRWGFFAQAQGTFIENDDANDTQTFDFDLYGVLAGADYRVNEGLTVGVTVGYDYGKADIHNGGGKIESDDVRIAVFAGQQIGEMFFVNAGAQVGYGHYEAKRKTAYGNANGDTDGWNAGLFADVGMMLTLSEELKISARPYVGLAYLHSEVGSFDDNLFDVDDFHGDSLRASIGCGVFWGFDLAETACSVGIDASYSHDFCGDEVDIDATYMDTGKDFGLTAKALSKDLFSVGPVIGVGLSESVSLFAGYALQVGTDSSIGQNAYIGARVSF